MPRRAPAVCPKQPCPNFRGSCPTHPARPQAASSTARGYGVAHRRLRTQVLIEEPWCPGFPVGIHDDKLVRTTVMDHKRSLRRGGTTTRGNVGGLCAGCNARKAVIVEGARPR